MTALYVDAWYDLKDDNEISIHKIANPIKVVISLIEHSFTESELVQLENITGHFQLTVINFVTF